MYNRVFVQERSNKSGRKVMNNPKIIKKKKTIKLSEKL